MKNTNNGLELFQENKIEQYVAFDYSELDSKIALELQQKAKKARMIMKNIEIKTMELRETLFEGHKLLANHHKGSFGHWVKSEIGISPQHANNLLRIGNYSDSLKLVSNSKENFENLGYKAQLLVSNPNTLPEVKELALSGEVTKYAELKAMHENMLKEKEMLENKVNKLAGLPDIVSKSELEKQEILNHSRQIQNENDKLKYELNVAKTEIKEVVVEKIVEKEVIPETVQRELKQAKEQLKELKAIEKLNYKKEQQLKAELEKLKLENKDLSELKAKEQEIEYKYEKLTDLYLRQSPASNRIDQYAQIFTFFDSMDEFYKNSMIPIVTSITTKELDVEEIVVKAQSILENVENWIFAFKQKYNLKSSSEIISYQ